MTEPLRGTVRRPRGGRRLTLRTRLALGYAGLIVGSGLVLITLIYLYMRFVPSYRIAGIRSAEPPVDATSGPSGPVDGVDVTGADDFLENLLAASALALVLMALLSGAVGWLVARRIVRPLGEIGEAARRAASGALDHRVALDGPPDEIQRLADTFDQMLASLERSFAAQRRFTANASHELHSPLATTKTMIDVVLSRPDPDPAELRDLVERVRDVNQGNIETVDALLDLATAEHAAGRPEPVDLAALTASVAADLRDDAAGVDVELEGPEGDALAWATPVLVRQAVTNLVRNAVRHNHRGGRATLTVGAGPEHAWITVSNTGPDVAPSDVAALVEPFVRGAGRTVTRGRGHGLGLAIAVASVAADGGSLALAARAGGGLTATVELPSAAARDPDHRSPAGDPPGT